MTTASIDSMCAASPTVFMGLFDLVTAALYARDVNIDPWQFAVSWPELRSKAMTLSDIRWVIARGIVTHAEEITSEVDVVREFRDTPSHKIAESTCFILTDDGLRALHPENSVVMRALSSAGSLLRGTMPGNPALASQLRSEFSKRTNPPQVGSIAEGGGRATDCVKIQPTKVQEVLSTGSSPEPSRPHWNSAHRELKLDDQVVKRFRVPAANQETILAVFEEEGWPESIDDPLPLAPGIDPVHRLQATIKRLNRNQAFHALKFHGNGGGRVVYWERLLPH